jgi:hypothetical protein
LQIILDKCILSSSKKQAPGKKGDQGVRPQRFQQVTVTKVMVPMIPSPSSPSFGVASKSGASIASEWDLEQIIMRKTLLREDIWEDRVYRPPLTRRDHDTQQKADVR